MRQEQSRSKSPAARILSLALALCMIAAFVPAFTLTAGAAGVVTISDDTLFTTSCAEGAAWYAFEFNLGTLTACQDFGFVDADGNTFAGACNAWLSGDGFYVADGERSISLSTGFTRSSAQDVGEIYYDTYSGDARVRVLVTLNTDDSTYTVTYYTVDDDSTATSFATVEYSGTPNGIALPKYWNYNSSYNHTGITIATADDAFANFVVYAGDDTDSISYDDTLVYTYETAADISDYDWYAFEFDLGTITSYEDFGFVDLDGKIFAGACDAWFSGDGFYVADGERSLTLATGFTRTSNRAVGSIKYNTYGDGTTVRAVVEKDTDEMTYSITYYVVVDSTATSFGTVNYSYTTSAPNGIAFPHEWNYAAGSGVTAATANTAFANFTVYAGNYPETSKTVTVTYTVDGTEVDSASGTYDSSTEDGYTFDEYYYSPNGTNVLYYAEEQQLSEDKTVEMTALDNWGNYSSGDTLTLTDAVYTIQSDNIVPNGDFSYDMTGWYSRNGADVAPTNYTVSSDNVPDDVSLAAVSSGNGNASSTNSIRRAWKIESGQEYYYSMWLYYVSGAGGDYTGLATTSAFSNNTYEAGGTAKTTNIFVYTGGGDLSTGWTQHTGTFTADDEYVIFHEGWGVWGVAEVEIYPVEEVEDATVTVTVQYSTDETADGVIDDLTYSTSVVKGSSIDTTAISNYAYNGVFYNADSETVSVDENATENITHIVTLVADTTKVAATSTFTWDYDLTSDNDISASLSKGNISGLSDTIFAVAWGDDREGILNFAIPCEDGYVLESATLNFVIGGQQGNNVAFNAYAMPTSDAPKVAASPTAGGTLVGSYSAALGSSESVTVSASITLDFSDCSFDVEDGYVYVTLRTDGTQNMILIYGADQGSYAPYLSDVVTVETATYTVEYVDENGDDLDTTLNEDGDATGTYTTAAANTLGYDDEEIVPYVTIPYFTGYIFTSKTVDTGTNTVTLAYTSTDAVDDASTFGANFFEDVTDDTTFVSLNMLGAHDAFTAGITSSLKYDAGGVALGDSGATAAALLVATGSTVANSSKAQDKTALELLEAGVRYFDIRLSRSTEDQDAGILYNNAPHTNGVFYTTHGVLSDEFRPIAYTIGQWLTEHPGEVVVLDFQEAFDDGDATYNTYTAINDILEEAGINDFATYDYNTSIKGVTYGGLTDSGNQAGVVMFARQIGYKAGTFYPRALAGTYDSNSSSGSGWEAGKLYSYYDSSNAPTSYSTTYIQTQVDNLDSYNDLDDPTGDHAAYHYARVMQAQSTGSSNLLTQAASDHTYLYTDLTSGDHAEWLSALPIVMVDAAGTGTDDLATLLQKCNYAQDVTVNYTTDDGTVVTDTMSLMVGTIFTDETQYAIKDGGDIVYYVPNTYTLKPYTCTTGTGTTASVDSSYTLYDITYVPSNGVLEIPVTQITDNVYTVRSGILYSSASGVGSGSDNPAFAAYNWGDQTVADYDRIGIAILTVEDTATAVQDYILTATQLRDTTYSQGGTVTFYAVSIDDYNSVDVSDSAALYAILDGHEVCAYATTANNDTNETTVTYTLDAENLETALNGGTQVVIIGNHSHGLYGLSSDMAITTVQKDYGVELYAGAQIRVGQGIDDEQELLGDSGLRFIAVVDKANTMANVDGAEIGIAIFDGGFDTTAVTAESAETSFENTDPVTTITPTTYQDESETIFTAAIVDIAESNYNRIYVAVPYVIVGGTTYYNWDATVARTPYQVAKGILVDSDTTVGDGYTESASGEALINVLNVYTNKTGARVTLAQDGDGYTVTAVTYANGATAFFDITESTDSETGAYVFTLSPKDGSNAEFYDYAEDYFRANNASAAAFETKVDGAAVELVDGNLVITIPAATSSDE